MKTQSSLPTIQILEKCFEFKMMLDYLVPGLFSTNALNSKLEDYLVPVIGVNQLMTNILTEIFMFSILSGGVSCSKGCCRRFGRIFGKCR